MNNGTKIRTILMVLFSFNTALAVTDVAGFDNPTVNMWYKIISLVAQFAWTAVATYYNNDYTEAASLGTGLTRQLKAEKKEGYDETGNGEDGSVFDDEEDIFEDEQ